MQFPKTLLDEVKAYAASRMDIRIIKRAETRGEYHLEKLTLVPGIRFVFKQMQFFGFLADLVKIKPLAIVTQFKVYYAVLKLDG
jgi:hypothetical protein